MPDISPTVLITGAARRIGRAIALELSDNGWAVCIHYNSSMQEAQTLAAEINKRGGLAALCQADLTDVVSTQALISQAAQAIGRPITALVNNASRFEPDEWANVTPQSWDEHFTINLKAPFLLSQAFAKALPSGHDGAIVNIVDQRVWRLTPLYMSYTLTKAALWTMTQSLAQALAPRIRVNAVGPGPVLASKHQTEAQFQKQSEALLLGRSATPKDVAGAVRYLLGASAVTGQMIAVDGGQHLAWKTPDIHGVE